MGERAIHARLESSAEQYVWWHSHDCKIVATRVLGSPAGEPPFHRIAEVYFPSMEALEQCAASEGGKQTIGNAVSISSDGAPVFLVAEEKTFVF